MNTPDHIDGLDVDLDENEQRRDLILLEMRQHFLDKSWKEAQCARCGKVFMTKGRNPAALCGKNECNGNEFLEKPSRKELHTAKGLTDSLSTFFSAQGYQLKRPISVISDYGNNLFVGTSGQHFDNVIHRDGLIDTTPLFVAQPVIRLQSEPIVGKIDGFTTSFINISTEQLQATPAQHLQHVERWLTALSQLGIYVGDITIRLKKDDPDWGKGQFQDAVMSFYYKGVEIAYANYFINVPQQSRAPVSISDVSFGLERVLWALNKTPSYFQGVGPTHVSLDSARHKEMDSLRTAVLMNASGIEPGHRDRGSKLRMFSKHIAEPGVEFPENLIRYYYQWWSQFSDLEFIEARVINSMKTEWQRTLNLKLQRTLDAPADINVEVAPDEYIRILVQRGITLRRIQEVIQSTQVNYENP